MAKIYSVKDKVQSFENFNNQNTIHYNPITKKSVVDNNKIEYDDFTNNQPIEQPIEQPKEQPKEQNNEEPINPDIDIVSNKKDESPISLLLFLYCSCLFGIYDFLDKFD